MASAKKVTQACEPAKTSPASSTPRVERATHADILRILDRHSVDLIEQLELPIRQVQLSMPRDEEAPRIRVSVIAGSKVRLPKALNFDCEGRKVRVPLERCTDFQVFRPL